MAEETYEEANEVFKLKICRDGMILLRIEALEVDHPSPQSANYLQQLVDTWGRYLDYLNTLYLFLDSATIRVMNHSYFTLTEITTRDAFRVRYERGKITGYNIVEQSVGSGFQMARFKATYGTISPQFDHRILGRLLVSREAIDEAVADFKRALNGSGQERTLASFAKSIGEYKVGNYETSIILAWFIIERTANELWRSHLDSLNKVEQDGQQRINSHRLKLLTGRDFPASLVTNMLELSGTIPFSLFKKIDAVRGFRNKIVHGDTSYRPSANDGERAIRTALELFENVAGISFLPNLSYSITSL